MAIIEVRDLGKRYGPRVAVDSVSFEVAEGEIFGVLGPNGAGKTTTVECVSGLRTPDRGTVSVLGRRPADVRASIGVQLQASELPERMRVSEALALFSSFYPSPVDWSSRLGLVPHLKAEFGQLSGGLKQRLSIALALIGSPRIAVLDELTTGLDPQARRDTWSVIEDVRSAGVTILLVTHFMEEAERLCDRVAVFRAGRIVALDTPSALVSRVDGATRVRFVPSAALDVSLLEALPEVTSVSSAGEQLVVSGSENLLHAVTSLLARRQVVARQLRVDQVSLDDAYVELTGGRDVEDH
ncbi:ABC transporter ATP-binding protein [Lentzea flaviverrucosa]|uniref:ABC-2 type transport system ATP-binding protein n=1 Tax=Lentzea flaviverrucosa TaxID=200379 RepID=A0A1H9SQM5_9PSEU|nr:ABC transporter ATP-binding protein [Lentzea flaviverrucosa]RDI25479.1 ABC-2 type transport system ATP-binding protein [Lentzea flaviverrucosa]SER87322.1 ABC-2 type transport system ATP-binding protein [Lentzea flaviverrucosa]